MPRPVFPVVRLPYDRPDRVARVLEAVRREFAASRRRAPAAPVAAPVTVIPPQPPSVANAMTAHVQQQSTCREPERTSAARTASTPLTSPADAPTVDQVTVGVRDCTLTPKARPDILVTAGGAPAPQNAYPADDGQYSAVPNGPYLLVPPVNITAEISRPPLTPLQQYTATSS